MTTQMVYVPLDMLALSRWSGHRGLMRRGVFDEGYAFHVLLSSVFGKAALQPFRLFRPSRGRHATLYAYSDRKRQELRDVAAAVGPPDSLEVLDIGRILTKPMPSRFVVGQRLGFDIRVRPVRRLASQLHDSQSGRVLRKGSEIDAFRVELLHGSPDGWRDSDGGTPATGISRESVYTDWLSERLTGVATIRVDSCRLAAFRRTRTIRGTGLGPEGPDAVLHGECIVRDPAEFAARLRRGIGRHRAYGYGMLIPRPPGTAPHRS